MSHHGRPPEAAPTDFYTDPETDITYIKDVPYEPDVDGPVQSIAAGTGINIDNTDPANPVIASNLADVPLADAIARTDTVFALQDDMVVTGIGAGTYSYAGQVNSKKWYLLSGAENTGFDGNNTIYYNGSDWYINDPDGSISNASASDTDLPSDASWTGSTVTAVSTIKRIAVGDVQRGGIDAPEVPAVATPQDIVDALIALNLVTQAS